MLSLFSNTFDFARKEPEITYPEPVSRIENIKNMVSDLHTQDILMDEAFPRVQELIGKMQYITHTGARLPNILSVLIFQDEEDKPIQELFSALNAPVVGQARLALHATCRSESAIKLCKAKHFDVIICRDTFKGESINYIASLFLKNGIDLPFIAISNGTDTVQANLNSVSSIYATIDEETVTSSKAVEVLCQQCYIRHKKECKMRQYAEELSEIIDTAERMRCKMKT